MAEWIDLTFERYQPKGKGDEHCRSGNGNKRETLMPRKLERQASTSPLTSETETEDTGITFIPRKTQVGSVGSCESWSDGTLVGEVSLKNAGAVQSGVVRTHTPDKGSTATISESELMRRRRLISL